MKVLFITKFEFVEPLGILYLATCLKKHNHLCKVIDLKFEKDIYASVKNISPDIIAYSITAANQKFYKRINLELKSKFRFISIFGGPHCTSYPEFIEEKGVDCICRGEGEEAIFEFVNCLEQGEDISKIQNIWVKIDGKMHKNDVRDLSNINKMPFVERRLLDKYSSYRKMQRRFIISGNGCPFDCSYCFSPFLKKLYKNKGDAVRKRSIRNIIEELKYIKINYKPKRLQFIDDNFLVDEKWAIEFLMHYHRKISIPFIIYGRADFINQIIAKSLKEAGCTSVQLGVESGNDYIRNKILKKKITTSQIVRSTKVLNKNKIKVHLQNMLGVPEESVESALQTLKLNIKCRPAYAWASLFQPYPGTELFDYCKEKKIFDGDINSFKNNYFQKSLLKIKEIKKIERMHHLFPLAVSFPFLTHFIKLMIKLPFDYLYFKIWQIYRVWAYIFKVKLINISELISFKRK